MVDNFISSFNVKVAPKYADDITFVTTSKEMINKVKETIPPQLKKYNLMVINLPSYSGSEDRV